MKTKNKTIVALCAFIIGLATVQAQTTSTPSPAFDVLHVFTPPPLPASTPSATQIGFAQSQFVSALGPNLKAARSQLIVIYLRLLSQFADDTQGALRLTSAQKIAALSPSQLTEVVTLSWQYYNLVTIGGANDANGIAIPSPSIPLNTVGH